MDRYCNKKRERHYEGNSFYKNKNKKQKIDRYREYKYNKYHTHDSFSKENSYSYKREDYDSYEHNQSFKYHVLYFFLILAEK